MNARKQAAAAGQSKYTTGKPCLKRGHNSPRYTSNGMCVECTKENNSAINHSMSTNKGYRHIMEHHKMVACTLHLPYKHTTILKSIERLLVAPNADQFISWIIMLDTVPLGALQLATVFDYRDGKVNVDPTTIPYRNNDAGQIEFQINGNWYIGDEINEVLQGTRSHVERVIEPI